MLEISQLDFEDHIICGASLESCFLSYENLSRRILIR